METESGTFPYRIGIIDASRKDLLNPRLTLSRNELSIRASPKNPKMSWHCPRNPGTLTGCWKSVFGILSTLRQAHGLIIEVLRLSKGRRGVPVGHSPSMSEELA